MTAGCGSSAALSGRACGLAASFIAALFFLVALLSFPVAVQAADHDENKGKWKGAVEPTVVTDEAQKHFNTGVEHYVNGKYGEAAAEFKKAHEINGHWAVRFNIASCYFELNKYSEAIDELWLFLEEGKDQIDEERCQEAMKLIEKAIKKVAKITIAVNLSDSELFINGEAVQWPDAGVPVNVNPGVHLIEVKSKDMEIWKSKVELKPGEEYFVEVNIKGKAEGKGGGKVKVKVKVKGKFAERGITLEGPRGLRMGEKEKYAGLLLEEKRISKTWFWVSTGMLIAAVFSATAMTIMTELDKGKKYSQAQAPLWIAAGFFTATTITLSVFTFKKRKKSRVSFTIVPVVGGDGSAGISFCVFSC